MGKKSGRHNNTSTTTNAAEAPKATAFVLKLPTHCQCKGCGDKIRAGVKDLTLRCEGILSLDQSALTTKGELAVVTTATVDPEKLRRRLRKATGKTVDLVFPKPPSAPADKPAAAAQGKDDAAAVQALLARLMQQQQPVHAHHGQPMPAAAAWNALQHGGGYGYPWVVQQQQQVPPPEPYFAAYPVGSWGAYAAAYPPHDGLGGAYGGGGGWFGH